MRHSILIFLSILIWNSGLRAQDNACESYKHVTTTFTTVNPHGVVLELTDTLTGSTPVVDSVWVTSTAFRVHPEALTVAHVQSGDTIDLTLLIGMTEIYYLCWIQLGECVLKGQFFFSGKAWDECLDYIQYHLSAYVSHGVLTYGLRATSTVEPPVVDSIWITPVDMTDTLLVSYAQPEEAIDVSWLEDGRYLLWVQTGDCVRGKVITKRKAAGIDDTHQDTPSADKVIKNGHIYIRRNKSTYTIQGQEVK